MVDYLAIFLTGISTGFGVIISHEIWNAFKEYRTKAKRLLKNKYIENEKTHVFRRF